MFLLCRHPTYLGGSVPFYLFFFFWIVLFSDNLLQYSFHSDSLFSLFLFLIFVFFFVVASTVANRGGLYSMSQYVQTAHLSLSMTVMTLGELWTDTFFFFLLLFWINCWSGA